MDTTTEKTVLAAALARTAAFVETRGQIESLRQIRLEAAKVGRGKKQRGMMTIQGQGLVAAYREEIACEVAAAGTAQVDGARLAKLIAAAPEGCQISLKATAANLSIADGAGRYRLALWPDEIAPRQVEPAEGLALPGDFLAALKRVSTSMSTEEIRAYLIGVAIGREAKTGLLSLTATDGHALQSIALETTSGAGATAWPPAAGDIILPAFTARVLGEAFEGLGDLSFRLDGTAAVFAGGARQLVTKLVDGVFPDWRRVLPTGEAARVTLDRAGLQRALARVALVGEGSEVKGIAGAYALLQADQGRFAVTSASRGGQSAGTESLACEMAAAESEGRPPAVAVNAAKLGALLAAYPGKKVTLVLRSPKTAIMIEGAENSICVLMPVRWSVPAELLGES